MNYFVIFLIGDGKIALFPQTLGCSSGSAGLRDVCQVRWQSRKHSGSKMRSGGFFSFVSSPCPVALLVKSF